jgi:hypothetical protein
MRRSELLINFGPFACMFIIVLISHFVILMPSNFFWGMVAFFTIGFTLFFSKRPLMHP